MRMQQDGLHSHSLGVLEGSSLIGTLLSKFLICILWLNMITIARSEKSNVRNSEKNGVQKYPPKHFCSVFVLIKLCTLSCKYIPVIYVINSKVIILQLRTVCHNIFHLLAVLSEIEKTEQKCFGGCRRTFAFTFWTNFFQRNITQQRICRVISQQMLYFSQHFVEKFCLENT